MNPNRIPPLVSSNQVAKELEIPRQIGDLQHSIALTEERLDNLVGRLTPVCSPTQPLGCPEQKLEELNSSLARDLYSLRARVVTINSTLDNLLKTLQV